MGNIGNLGKRFVGTIKVYSMYDKELSDGFSSLIYYGLQVLSAPTHL